MTQQANTPATPAKTERKRKEKIAKVFKTKAELDAGQKDAIAKEHDYDTRKFQVTSADGKTTFFVLGYSAANVAGQVHKALGIKVEELDPSPKSRTATPEQMVQTLTANTEALQKLSDKDREALLKALQATKKK